MAGFRVEVSPQRIKDRNAIGVRVARYTDGQSSDGTRSGVASEGVFTPEGSPDDVARQLGQAIEAARGNCNLIPKAGYED